MGAGRHLACLTILVANVRVVAEISPFIMDAGLALAALDIVQHANLAEGLPWGVFVAEHFTLFW